MNGILSALVTILFHVLTLASKGFDTVPDAPQNNCSLLYFHDGDGIYCTDKKQTWWNSMPHCLAQGGTPLPYKRGLGNILDTNILKESIGGNAEVWTADYLVTGGFKTEELCGFIYKYKSSDKGQVFYGNCNRNISYICRNSTTSKWQIYQGHYRYAIERSCGEVDDNVLRNITDIFKSGYYWVKDSLMFEKKPFHGQYADWRHMLNSFPTFNPFRCGAFSKDAGPYFRICTDEIQSLCHFVNPPDTGVYKTCFKDSTTATKRSALTTSFTISNHLVTKPTTRQNFENLGKTVGLPVGLSLAVICGIMFAIYMFRRYKCWKTTSHGNNNNSKSERPDKKSSSEQGIAYGNSSYNATPNEYSFVNKTVNKGNDGEQCYVTEEEYDVSGNVQSNRSNTSNNIYNTTQSEAYVTTNIVSRGVHCDHVYDRTQRQETDSRFY